MKSSNPTTTRLYIDTTVAKAAGPTTSLELMAPTTCISFMQLADILLSGPDSLKRKHSAAPEVDTDTSETKRLRLDTTQQTLSPTGLAKKLNVSPTLAAAALSQRARLVLTIKVKKAYDALASSEVHATGVADHATAVHDAPRNTFRFLDLPGEMRNLVYKELLTRDKANGRSAHLAILRANKQIHTEAHGLLYSEGVATIKLEAFMRGSSGGVRLEGDLAAAGSYSLPGAMGPVWMMRSIEAVSKYADLWPEYLTKIPVINLDLNFDDSGDNVADSWAWYANDFSSMNRALCSLASHLASNINPNTTSRIAGRKPKINITINATKLQDPTFTQAFDNILYPLSKVPGIYTINLPTSDSPFTFDRSTPASTTNLLTIWSTSLRPLSTPSLNLTPSLAKPSSNSLSRTRYPLTPLPGLNNNYNPTDSGHLHDLLAYGRHLFSTLKYVFEDKACFFSKRGDLRLIGLMRVLNETVMALRTFDLHLRETRRETAQEALVRVKKMYEESVGEMSPL